MDGTSSTPINVLRRAWIFSLLLAVSVNLPGVSAADDAASHFRKEVQPLLAEYCYDCHADGANKGKVAFDEFKSHDQLLAKRDLWLAVLKNVRAGLMPPEKKPRPSDAEKQKLEAWIKKEVFDIDPQNPDP